METNLRKNYSTIHYETLFSNQFKHETFPATLQLYLHSFDGKSFG